MTRFRIRFATPLLLALAGTWTCLIFAYVFNPYFFFLDDRAAQYFPYGLAIKHSLLQGVFPFLTTRTVYGGALWLDWQYGIFNPVSLALAFAITPEHLGLSGLLTGLITDSLLVCGTYTLGRGYHLLPRQAALFGLLMGISPYVLYVGAADWGPALSSLAWFMFAWSALKRLLEAQAQISLHVLKTSIFIYLLFTSGWPHTDVAFCILAVVLFVENCCAEKPRPFRFLAVAGLAAALCAPALAPVLAAFAWTDRYAILAHPDNTLTPSPWDVLNVSNPAWWPEMRPWAPRTSDPVPLFFLGWFTLPFLAFIRQEKLSWRQYASPLAALVIFAILATGVPEMQYLRYPVRWLSQVHAAFLLCLLLALQNNELVVVTRKRFSLALATVAALAAAAYIRHPVWQGRELVCLAPILFMAAFASDRARRHLTLFLGTTSVIAACVITCTYPSLQNFTNHWQKAAATVIDGDRQPKRGGYTLYSGWPRVYEKMPPVKPEPATDGEFPTAAMGIYYDIPTLNGYSSIGQRAVARKFGCVTGYGPLCTVIPISSLLRREPETRQPYIDLLKVNRVVTDKIDLRQETKSALGPGWQEVPQATTVVFERNQGETLPGTVSWMSPSLSAVGGKDNGNKDNGNEESLRISNGNAPGLVVFARLFYPGFRAFLDGKGMTVRPIDELLVGVEIPPAKSGTLKLIFRPPFFYASLLAAGLGFLCWGIAAVLEQRRKTRVSNPA